MSARIDPAEYVLGMLEGADLQEARRLESEDPQFAAEVRALAGVGARLDALQVDEWDTAGPPPLRVDAAALGSASAGPVRSRRRSRLGALGDRLRGGLTVRPAFAGALAAVLLGLGVGAGLLAAGGGDDGAPAGGGQVIALERFDDGPAGARGRATVGETGGVREVTLDTRGLAPSGAGTSYEVWMIRDAEHMVGLGRFKVGPDGRATVTLPVTVNAADYPIMDVSIEPDSGPASHSGVSVLRSAASAA